VVQAKFRKRNKKVGDTKKLILDFLLSKLKNTNRGIPTAWTNRKGAEVKNERQ